MFESTFLTSSEDLRKLELLKVKFSNIKKSINSSLKEAGKINPFTGESLTDEQISELKRKQNIIQKIEPLLTNDYSKLQEFTFYFNNGKFRTDSEIEAYKRMQIEKEWSVCEKFNKHVVIQLGLFGLLMIFTLLMPAIIWGRVAIYLYLFPVWPVFVLSCFYLIYKLSKRNIFKNKNKNVNLTKEYIAETTMTFMQKFY